MINSIRIENFRCFSKIRIKNLKTINLIGGQNNSGKTALLEAVLLSSIPHPSSVKVLRQFRNENDKNIKNANGKVWDSLFYNLNRNQVATITTEQFDKKNTQLEFITTRDIESVIDATDNGKEQISELIQSKFSDAILLHFKGNTTEKDFNYFLIPDKNKSDIGVFGRTPNGFDYLPFLHANFRLKDDRLAALYSQAKENKKIKELNGLLNLIDNRIVGSEIDAPGGEPVIKLILDDEQSLPLGLFGDAVRKLTEMILVLLNVSDTILLIDEIENGIHYTKHEDIWHKLFKIAKNNKIQIFATSHSGEMIRAFNKVGLKQEFENDAIYFELGRTQDTNKIIVNPMDMKMLQIEILTNNAYRGE